MAHDPTRSWPTGKGPDNTSVPGAAWLELLDGQAFPVVGAGVMVRDGNVWVPASSSNPLHTRDAALASLIGALNATKEVNPDAASASMLALLRGMLATFGKETTLAAVKAAAESLAQEDFATETTLAALLSAVGNLATEATLSGVKSAVDTLAGTVADGAQKVTLSGQKAAQTILPREIRAAGSSVYRRTVTPPIGAKGCRLELSVFGVTGQFGSGEGINLSYREHTDAVPEDLVETYSTTKTTGTGNRNQHLIMVYPGLSEENDGAFRKVDGVLGRRLVVQVDITGTFAAGEGFDCQLDVVWIM